MSAVVAISLCSSAHAPPHMDLSCSQSITSNLEDEEYVNSLPPAPNIQTLFRNCNVLGCAYLMCSIVSFCSSSYTGPGSALDVLSQMSDVMCIDITSALFVMAGCAVASLFAANPPIKQAHITRHVCLAMLLDLYCATACSLVLGSLHAVIMARFKWSDVAFTAVDGITTLRVLDFRQSETAPHSFNLSVWPVQCLFWCVLSTNGLIEMEAWLVQRMPAMADGCICLMSLLGIVLFTVFGSMQASSNIFYANASSVTYRTLEFNLGVHVIFLHKRHVALVAALRRVCQQAAYVVALLCATVWFAEIGRSVPPRRDDSCLRLYYRNTCLQDHHGFFLRGCAMALFALLCTNNRLPDMLHQELRLTGVLLSALCFCWPVCIAVKLVLDATFGTVLINQNRPFVLVMCATTLFILSFSYASLIQPKMLSCAKRVLKHHTTSQAPPPDSLHTPLVSD